MTDPGRARGQKVVSCGAVLFRMEEGEPVYLLLRYTARHWDFPKGHQEQGESEEETTRREIAEETGITQVEFVPGFRHTVRYSFPGRGGRVRKTVHFRLAATTAARAAVQLSHEHVAHAWLTYEEARTRLTYGNARSLLDAAHAQLRSDGLAPPG